MKNLNEIKTAIFPVGGLGSRFLPVTKSVPKELLPILNIPLIEYAVDEAIQSGIEKFIFVVSPNKNSILDHFKRNKKLENNINYLDKKLYSLITKYKFSKNNFLKVEQSKPKGLGHALWCARNYINGPFAVILPDDLIRSKTPCIKQLVNIYKKNRKNIVAVQEVDKSNISKYGIISYKEKKKNNYFIDDMIEKPSIKEAPTNLAVIGRYILLPEIFKQLSKRKIGYGGEIQLTDAIKGSINMSGVIGCKFEGNRYDCGNVLGSLEAQISLALQNKSLRNNTKKILKRYIKY